MKIFDAVALVTITFSHCASVHRAKHSAHAAVMPNHDFLKVDTAAITFLYAVLNDIGLVVNGCQRLETLKPDENTAVQPS